MPGFSFKRSGHSSDEINKKIEELGQKPIDIYVTDSLETNIEILKKLFIDVDVLQLRFFQSDCKKAQKYCIAYCDGLINLNVINDNVIKPLQISTVKVSGKKQMDDLANLVLTVHSAKKVTQYQEITEAITYGDTVLFAEGASEALILDTKGFQIRAIAEPENEKNLSGPREGFTESLLINLSMIRRKIRSNELKTKYYTLGKKTKTQIGICYIEGIVNKQILKELYRRLDKIDIDGVLDTNYITELIKDSPLSPFRTTGYTERPDVVVGKLLEGRIAIVLDGTPDVLTIPYLFIENFQSSEDYYFNFYYTSFSRFLRIFSFFITISLIGFYVAMAGFHHEVLPLPFLLNIASERNSIPFSAAFEAFALLFVFDILRETGSRMPANIGQTMSIVGAIILGQAAVDAKIVASPMIIIVATSGITSLMVPKMNAPIIYIRLFILILSAMFGFTGTIVALSIIIIHLLHLRSFGIPQISAAGKIRFQEVKDTYIRAPWWLMRMRWPKSMATDKIRMKNYDKDIQN
ncbi:MAG: spore germination protein [Bacillota bacterium]|nr:spore germination protein [Bacillota bacterium]